MKTMVIACVLAALAATAGAKVRTQLVEYKQGDAVLEGYLAYDDAARGKRPGILVVHAWMGLDDNARHRAEMLAQLGYVAFAADIYGKGVRPKDRDEAGKLAGTYKADRALLRQRVNAAFDQLVKNPRVDPTKTAAIGYCFGGTTVIELARSGTDVKGVVSFHGGLDSPTPADGRNIKAKLLVLHGAADRFEKPSDLAAFQQELADAKVDWQLVEYGGAVHCFTDRGAGSDPSTGCAYDPVADARSWAAMRAFFDELFSAKK
ncbi:MAG TPA: dienelactone hydrolase family protein [Kofleriaceae bacterium]|nr:dienelactone hydrolase family protein [Kofleriaceae bacterium]